MTSYNALALLNNVYLPHVSYVNIKHISKRKSRLSDEMVLFHVVFIQPKNVLKSEKLTTKVVIQKWQIFDRYRAILLCEQPTVQEIGKIIKKSEEA